MMMLPSNSSQLVWTVNQFGSTSPTSTSDFVGVGGGGGAPHQQQQQQQLMYCFTPATVTAANAADPSGFNLLPAGAAACFSLPLGAGSLPPEYAASQQVAFVPAEHILVAGAKRSFDDVLLSQSSLMSNGTDLSSAQLDMANDAKKFKLDQPFTIAKPSRVIHFRGIPGDASENEVLQLGQPFGIMTNLVLAKKKNQALLEMADVSGAQAMINYYSERPPQIRGHTVYVQFSNHDQLKTEVSTQNLGTQVALKAGSQLLSSDDQPKTVLRVIIENLLYAVTIDILKQIFSRYGQVLKIITFTKNNTFQALIQYSSPAAAHTAKTSLNGQNIYQGCCTMRIDYSKLQSLNVRYNNSKSRDYTDMTLPSGDMTPVTFSPGTAAAAVAYCNSPGNMIAQSFTPTVIPGIGPALAYCTTAPGNAQGLGIVQGALPFGSCIVPASTLAGIRLPWQTQANSVLLVTNLSEERVTPDALFTLFGVYGDVIRVKIMFNKKDNALVQFQDGNQAQIALTYLDKVKLWGRNLKVALSKHTLVQMPKEQQTVVQDAGLTKDYTNSALHRFKKPNSKNYNNIYAPSATLHLSNIPPVTTEEHLMELFAQHGTVVAFKFFETDHKMALVQMGSVEEAVMALIELHNHQLAETSHLRVSFSKSTIAAPVPATEYLEP
jgi:polypyrimidine tract-binding protein 1